MPSVKTSISIPEGLFVELQAAAGEMKLSRSQVFALAAKQFLWDRESRRMVEKLEEVYGDGPDEEEKEFLRLMKARYRKIIEGEW